MNQLSTPTHPHIVSTLPAICKTGFGNFHIVSSNRVFILLPLSFNNNLLRKFFRPDCLFILYSNIGPPYPLWLCKELDAIQQGSSLRFCLNWCAAKEIYSNWIQITFLVLGDPFPGHFGSCSFALLFTFSSGRSWGVCIRNLLICSCTCYSNIIQRECFFHTV